MAKCPKCGKDVAPKKLGRWLANLTKRERGQNLQSACASAAAKPSEQQSASRKSNLLKEQKPLFLFFELAYFRKLVI